MNTNSTTPRPCAGCSRDLGDVMQPLVVDFGFRYRVCAYGCASRLLARLTASLTTTTTTTSATNDTVRVFGIAQHRRYP
jgi:hypothetical protein